METITLIFTHTVIFILGIICGIALMVGAITSRDKTEDDKKPL